MSYDGKGCRQLSVRAAMAWLVVGLIAFSPAYLSAQEPADQQQAENEASEEARFKKHLQAGAKAYADKDYGKALEELQTAHDINPRASILFNMGLISEKKGDLNAASKYYSQFIGAPEVDLPARKRASERLAVVSEILDQRNKSESNQEMTNLMPALEAMNADLEEMGDGEISGEATTQDQQQESRQAATTPVERNDTAGEATTSEPVASQGEVDYGWQPYAAFTLGTGAIVGGVVAMALYNNSVDEAKKTPETTTLHMQHEREASDYLTLAGGMFITGGVVLGLGTYFILAEQADKHSSQQADDAPSTSVSVGPDYVGVKYSLDF